MADQNRLYMPTDRDFVEKAREMAAVLWRPAEECAEALADVANSMRRPGNHDLRALTDVLRKGVA